MHHDDDTLHVAFYAFEDLQPLSTLRQALHKRCEAHTLLGTILLAEEGINGMLAGPHHQVDAWLKALITDRPALADMPVKRTTCAQNPFKRLLVKLKPEIVTLRVPGVTPAQSTAPKLPPAQLRDWLRAGEDIVIVDVRNDFECRLGTFRGAINPNTRAFHEFPDFVAQHEESWRGKKVVTFCTGGIRCEKATSWMLERGAVEAQHLYQLDGGILNYFNEIKDAEQDWAGELFVFDERVSLDTKMRPTGRTLNDLQALELGLAADTDDGDAT